MQQIIIRRTRECDIEELLAVQKSCYPPDLQENAHSFAAKIAQNFSFAAEKENKIVAYFLAFPVDLSHFPAWNSVDVNAINPNAFYLHDLAVHPAMRGTGLAQKLLHHVLAHRPQQLDDVFLIAVQNAQNFWEKQGFIAADIPFLRRQVQSYGDDALLMRLK